MTSPWRTDRLVAQALTDRWLLTDWHAHALVSGAREVLGAPADSLDALVEEVMVLFDERPLPERRDELTDVIAYSGTFRAVAEQARSLSAPLRVWDRERAPSAVTWPVPELPELTAVAAWLELSAGQLLWLSDAGGYQRRDGPGPLHLYTYRWTPRRGRAPRLLEAPTPILKRVQRQLLHDLLGRIPVHPAAHGFVPGRSVRSHVRQHLGAQLVVTVDLQDFFAAVQPARLAGMLRVAGYRADVARSLTGVCVTRTPRWVLASMPPGGTAGSRFDLRSRLRGPHLPQGAPTSPALANLACFALDRRLTGYAGSVTATYSRYADDLTFSGDAAFRLVGAPAVLRGIQRIVQDEGFALNPPKTRVQPRSGRQTVTGLVVNDRPNVSRQHYDRLRAVLHEARTAGPAAANRDGAADFRSQLQGRVEWVASVNPSRGRRLRADLDAIQWPDL